MERKKELYIRAYGVFVFFVVLSAVIVFRVGVVSVSEGDKWREKGKTNVNVHELKAERGNIYSEDYNLLCTSLQFFDVNMDPSVVSDKLFNTQRDSLAMKLAVAPWSKRTYTEWRKILHQARKKKKQFLRLARNLNVDQYNEMKTFPILRHGRFRGGFLVEKRGKRVKPFKGLASRTIGMTRKNAQDVGLERAFDRFLRGETRPVLMKKVSSSPKVWVPVYDIEGMEPMKGNDIVTTINVNIQDIVHTELKKRLVELEAEGGVAVVMDVETGAVKAISNLRRVSSGEYSERHNDAVGKATEQGSTMKLPAVLSLLDDGHCRPSTSVHINGGKFMLYDRYLRDSEQHGIQVVDLQKAFEMSSNVGIGRLMHEFYNQSKADRARYISNLEKYGLTRPTGIEIPGEVKGMVQDTASYWSGTRLPWMAQGYAMAQTPIQVLNLYNAVANGGRLMRPYLVSDIMDDTRVVKHFSPQVLNEAIAKKSTIESVKRMMEGVVLRGTAKVLQSDIVKIAGKTGTAKFEYGLTAGEGERKYNSSFAGYFPSDDPKYSMIIVVYYPKGTQLYGASATGPAYKTIAERIVTLSDNLKRRATVDHTVSADLPDYNAGYRGDFKRIFDYVGLTYKSATTSNWVETDPYDGKMLIEKKKIRKPDVPDVRGMGARDATYVLEYLGMNVKIAGVGKVAKQSIRPGEKIKGQDIELILN